MDALLLQTIDFLDESVRIDHDTIANYRQLSRSHHARRQERQFVSNSADDQSMASIMSALKADHDVGLLGQPIDDLALALVSPLGSNDDHIGHAAPFLRAGN